MAIPVEWLGGIGTVLIGVVAKSVQMYRYRARSRRSRFQAILENGDREAVYTALTMMDDGLTILTAAQAGMNTRVTKLAARLQHEAAEAREEHSELRDRLVYLEERLRSKAAT